MESASILVVDDEPGIALLCTRVLKRAGYDVLSETNPRAAIEYLGHTRCLKCLKWKGTSQEAGGRSQKSVE